MNLISPPEGASAVPGFVQAFTSVALATTSLVLLGAAVAIRRALIIRRTGVQARSRSEAVLALATLLGIAVFSIHATVVTQWHLRALRQTPDASTPAYSGHSSQRAAALRAATRHVRLFFLPLALFVAGAAACRIISLRRPETTPSHDVSTPIAPT
jgi:hypothetical protein